MDPRVFLNVAFALAHKDAPSDGDLRTAVGRAYYGLYNTAVDFLGKCKVSIVDNQAGHRVVPEALRACGDVPLRDVAAALDMLRTARWEADYVMTAAAPEHARTVKKHLKHARQAVNTIDSCEQDADRFREVKITVRRWATTAANVRAG
jgi:hypothetical protein